MPVIECIKEGCDWSTPVNYTDHPSGSYNQAFRLGRMRYNEHLEKEHNGDTDSNNQGSTIQDREEHSVTSNAVSTTGKETKDKESQASN